ncbi:MAG: 2OG-Fe(II) oxygenase [Luteimonas sp.]
MSQPSAAIALERFIQVYDHALEPRLCRQMIDSFTTMERFHRINGKDQRAGLEQSRWTELDITPFSDAQFRGMLLQNMEAHLQRYTAASGLTIPVPATDHTSELIIKRYGAGGEDTFQPHFDALGPVSNRYLVFLWYLNDVDEGGETVFPDIGLKIKPMTGRLLMFPPYWMFQHAGLPPVSNEKYILSTYYLFQP